MTQDKQSRLTYLDNLRIYLTILVILHHAALAYGGNGNWGVHPTIPKFLIVSLIAVPVCFLLSSLIRKIPYVKRVLG